MKKEVINRHNLSDSDIDKEENRVKLLMFNSRDDILLCRVNGVYNFVGGHIEGDESLGQCAQRELLEETGIRLDPSRFVPFYELQQYEQNYYNLGKNYLTTIYFMEGNTDVHFDYSKRHLDSKEAKRDISLEYVPFADIENVLNGNRPAARKEKREFITDEMLHVIDEYKKYRAEKSKIETAQKANQTRTANERD